MPFKLYNDLKESIRLYNQKDLYEENNFIDGLPHRLKIETALYIYEDKFKNAKFLKTVK